jgi:flagellar biosynthesis/type III secretory pathway protein FliH
MKMKAISFKKFAAVAALGLAMLVGAGEIDAQGLGRLGRNQKQSIKQQQKLEKQQLKLEQERLRLQRQRLEMQQARLRVNRGGRWYNTDRRGAELLRQAVNEGYRQGFAAGRADRNSRRGLNWGGSSIYRSGTIGWQSHVDRGLYQHYFQQGFQRGYQDGYNSRYQYGSNSGGSLNILGSILGAILNIQQY